MTMEFAQQFKKKLKCAKCQAAPPTGYKMCVFHLEQAKLAYRAWTLLCSMDGRCIRCSRKPLPGQLRCRMHARLNREQCLAWSARNSEYIAERWRQRVAETKRTRNCAYCGKNPVIGETLRCGPCRDRLVAYKLAHRRLEPRA